MRRHLASSLKWSTSFVIAMLILGSCGPRPTATLPAAEPKLTVTSPARPTAALPTPALTPTIEKAPLLWVAPAVPEALKQAATEIIGLRLVDQAEQATLILDQSGQQYSTGLTQVAASQWVYALTAPFPTITDGVSFAELSAKWSGQAPKNFPTVPLLISEDTLQALIGRMGTPAAGQVSVLPEEEILDTAWQQHAWAILPFEQIEPRWKVLQLDGQSPIHNDFVPSAYPLSIKFELAADPSISHLLDLNGHLPASNRDPNQMTVLDMTGVTAMVRATATRMEQKGVLYPAEDIGSLLASADLTHISNEIPFAQNCPPPSPIFKGLLFCSNPNYIQLLEAVGTDLVEMTGNHFQDWGSAATLFTIDLYDQHGWPHYGGGRDLADAQTPLLIENHGNKLAFLGCNPVGPQFAWATSNQPGAAPCDFDLMHSQIQKLKAQGYLPIVTFQYYEYYSAEARPNQLIDYRGMVDAGAEIVSGSQAHMPQIMEFYQDRFIHYGLGNLFFDQMAYLNQDGVLIEGTRNGFIDRHVFYSGRYINTELITTILEDYARPRLMTSQEREQLLHNIFAKAGWPIP